LELNALIHGEFVLDTRRPLMDEFGRLIAQDSLKPFRDTAGKPLRQMGRHILRDGVSEEEHACIEQLMLEYGSQPTDVFKRLNLIGFELEGALGSPDYYGNRILLDEASCIIYRVGGYIAAPCGQRVEVDHQRVITLVHHMNEEYYPHGTREDYPYEERFMLPICRKMFPKNLADVQLEYDCMYEDSDFTDGYRSLYSEFSIDLTGLDSPKKGASPGRTSRTSKRAGSTHRGTIPQDRKHNDQHPEDAMMETGTKTPSTATAPRGIDPKTKARTTMPAAPENRDDTESLRALLKEVQEKYDQQSIEVA
jgi:hypothetical protein